MDSANRIDSLKGMLEKEPNDLFLTYALGLEYTKSPDTFGLAKAQFKKALDLDNNYLAAYYQLGQLLELLNNKQEALVYYQSGLEKAKEQKNNKAINEFGEAIFMLE
jgi:tetratricopeptide (TPR) repeat protein